LLFWKSVTNHNADWPVSADNLKTILRFIMPNGAMQAAALSNDVQLNRIDPEQNMRRFYRLTVQHDLFGNVSLIRVWGRIGSRGRQIIDTHADECGAINALIELAYQKQCRGYGIVSSHFY
jgi:predicted DNA-binding WGR domain protein